MRNEMILQNYTLGLAKCYLCGKEPCNPIYIAGDKNSKEFWINLFETAIEDLKAGGRINGKGLKNSVDYWENQIELVKAFERTY